MTKKSRGPNLVDIAVGKRVRLLRLQAGMSQTTLGEMLGVTFQQVQKYEKGTNRIAGSRLTGLARVFKCDVNHLFSDTGDVMGNSAGAATDWIVDLATSSNAMRQLLEHLATIRDDHDLIASLRDVAGRLAGAAA